MTVKRKFRWRRWRSEVAVIGNQRVRITRVKGRIVGVEVWTPLGDGDRSSGYSYLVVKE